MNRTTAVTAAPGQRRPRRRITWAAAGALAIGTVLAIAPAAMADPDDTIVAPGFPCMGAYATIVGTSAGETIIGTSGDDVISALGGNDYVYGLGGNDKLCGNDGNDYVSGGSGNDELGGQNGNDRLVGGADWDFAHGGAGTDNCSAEFIFDCP